MTIQQENAKLTRAGYPPLADAETLHTPGPWRIAAFDGPREYASIESGNGISETLRICDIPSWPCAISEMKANARLIAAAPDLLSALQRAYNAIAWEIPGGGLSDQEEEELLETLRAAIAKAEGGAK